MIKKFNQFTNEGLRDKMTSKYPPEKIYEIINKHDESKERIKELLEELLKEYDTFSKTISTKHWRTSASYYSKIRDLLNIIEGFEKITFDEFVEAAPFM